MTTEKLTKAANRIIDGYKEVQRVMMPHGDPEKALAETDDRSVMLAKGWLQEHAWNDKVFAEATLIVQKHSGIGEGGHTIDRLIVINKMLESRDAEIARLRTEIAAFQGLMTNVVPGDGSGEEVPATPESLRAYIKELQDEWDGAEKRLAAARAEEAEAIITWLKSGNVLTVSIDRSEMIAYLRARHPKEQANDPPRP